MFSRKRSKRSSLKCSLCYETIVNGTVSRELPLIKEYTIINIVGITVQALTPLSEDHSLQVVKAGSRMGTDQNVE